MREEVKQAFRKLGYLITDEDTIISGFHGATEPLVYNFLGAWDLVGNALRCYEPGTGNLVQEILPTYIIKQIHTTAKYFAVRARNEDEAIFNLQTNHHEEIEEEFLFMNDVSEWEISLDE